MITAYKRRSNIITLCGLLLFGLGLGLAWLGDRFFGFLPRWVEAGLLTFISTGIVLVIVGVCYYSAAKGYSAAWGAVLFLFCTVLSWLILLLLRDKEKETPDEPPEKIPFPQQAAKASLVAPLLSVLIGLLVQPQIRGNRIGMFILGCISTSFLIAGFILGIAALIRVVIRRQERAGILGKALAGTMINGIFVIGMLLYVPMVTKGNWHPNWKISTPKFTYNQRGVRFSYPMGWALTETTADRGRPPLVVTEGPHDSGVGLAFYSPADQETLEHFAEEMTLKHKFLLERDLKARSINNTTQPVIHEVGGVAREGLQSQLTCEIDNMSLSYSSCYFILSDDKHKIMVFTRVQDSYSNEDNPRIDLVLNSLRVEGMAGPYQPYPSPAPAKGTKKSKTGAGARKAGAAAGLKVQMIAYKPTDACALIGSKTVMTGDVIEGFKIIAIEQNSVTVQSPAGTNKVLHLGDDLK